MNKVFTHFKLCDSKGLNYNRPMVKIYAVDLTCVLTRSDLGIAMCNLADTYSGLGRHQDALVLKEKTLELRRRVLPQNHPDIGVA